MHVLMFNFMTASAHGCMLCICRMQMQHCNIAHCFTLHISQVFGRKPYESARTLPTPELAMLILRQYSLAKEQIQRYTRHVALLVSNCMHA